MWKVLVLSSIGVGSVLLLAKHLLTPTETVREDANEESCISNNEETTRASERRARSRKKTLFYLKRRRPTRINISAKKAPLRAPKAGVTFGFGGKLVSFHSSSGHSEVNVRDLVTELNLVSTSSEFEVAIKSGDRSSLRLLCDQKYQQSGSEDDRETWGFLKVMFEDEGTARTKLLNHLGFSLPAGEVNETIEGSCPTCLPTDSSFDDGVQRALVVGDYKGAVAQCIAANKMADALVIAQVGGTSLWESTRDQYLTKNSSPYLKVVAAMVNNDLVSLVKTRPLKSWKETLALLCTFAQRDDWTLLCDALASRLRASGNTLAATLCYICSGNIDRTVEIWSKNVTTEHEGKTYVELFQDLMEKTVILALATGQKRFSASLCKLVEKYVEILASQGLLTTAMEYLRLMGSDNLSPELVILRDRIALSSEPEEEASGFINSGNSRLPEAPSYGVNQTYSGAGPSGNYYQVKLFPKKVTIVLLCFVLGMLAILAGFFLFSDGQSSFMALHQPKGVSTFDECIKDCEKPVERGRELRSDYKMVARALTRKGTALVKMAKTSKDYDPAIETFQKALTEHRNPDTLKKLNDAERAKEELEQQEYYDPELAEKEREKGNECFKEQKYPDAIRHYTEALRRNPKDAKAYSNRAACYTKLGAMPEGLKDAEKCIEIDPKFSKGYTRKGAIQFFMKELDKALETYQVGLKHDPQNPELLERVRSCVQQINRASRGDLTPDELNERQAKAMQDPEIQNILTDPVMAQVLKDLQENPKAAQDHMKNPSVMNKIQKLISAGIVQMR